MIKIESYVDSDINIIMEHFLLYTSTLSYYLCQAVKTVLTKIHWQWIYSSWLIHCIAVTLVKYIWVHNKGIKII